MAKRLPLNSVRIRKSFPKFYEELFSACQVAVSSSDSFFWAGEYARFFGGMAILQKLPTKTLVGLEILNERKFCFADTLFGFNPNIENFQRVPFDYAKEIRLINFLKEYWPTIDPTGKIKGFRIHILSESRCGGGLGTTGVVLSCLAASLLLMAGKITTKDIEEWESALVDDLLNSPRYRSFRQVFRLGWRLTAICRDGNASGVTSFGALVKTSYPIVCFSKNVHQHLADKSIAAPRNNLENCKIIENIPFWGSRLEEIFPLRLPQPWPIDIARVYAGNLINTENIFKSLSKLKLDLENLTDVLSREFSINIRSEGISLDYFSNFDTETNDRFSYHDYLDILNITAVKMLLSFKDIFMLGQHEESLHKFISVINQVQDFNHFLGHSTPTLDQICDHLVRYTAKENELGLAGAKIEGIGKGGHVLLVSPEHTMSEGLVEEIDKLAAESKKDIYLDWLGELDGFGESGLIVEQFMPESRFSSFISNQSCQLTTFVNQEVENKIIENCDRLKIASDYDLIFSVAENKIYICGQPLTSKEIPSAKATIEIFSKLLKKPDLKLSNREFYQSSYGQNRYDLQSKIFIPLDKALRKIANKELNFQITGSLYDDFRVSVDPKNISIAVINELT
jgi:mevalonate kinase